jgi:hypothetical protein
MMYCAFVFPNICTFISVSKLAWNQPIHPTNDEAPSISSYLIIGDSIYSITREGEIYLFSDVGSSFSINK